MIHRLKGSWRWTALALILAPLFMSYIVKLYALRNLFGSNGYIAAAFAALGLDVPVTWLLFNQTAVFITMAIVYLPFAVVPIFLTLEKIPSGLSAAAADLGARPGQTFWRVVFPLSLPGTVAGGMFVLILALGDFVTPQMMGGTRGFTYGKLVFSQFGLAYEWPFGAAMSVILLLISIAAIAGAVLIARKGAVAL
jgi:spermidine/putrescine transport system permease protein